MRRIFDVFVLIVLNLSMSAQARTEVNPASTVSAVLSLPDNELDYTTAKLVFDHIIDPEADEIVVMAELDAITESIRRIVGENPRSHDVLQAVQQVIYQSGDWNDNRPFAYDLDDPLGLNVHTKLLSTYLETRLGNCVSMPILQLILADRLGANVHLATAPLHLFVRYTDSRGNHLNIESTSGGHPARDGWYREQFQISDAAIDNGIYLRTLTRRETVAHMATTVVEWLISEGRFQEAIEVADVILEHFPGDVYTTVKRGHSYGELLRTEFDEQYGTQGEIPQSLRARYEALATENAAAFTQAEAWGWQPLQ